MLEALALSIRTVPDFPKPGIQFKDITPLLADVELMRFAVDQLAQEWSDAGVTKVVGIESRGFILGPMLAQSLNVGFVPIRKKGKLPFTTISETYALEYGTDTIEMHTDALTETDLVLIHDDVIATGGTAAAAHRLIESAGAQVAGHSFLIELSFLGGRNVLPDPSRIHALITY